MIYCIAYLKIDKGIGNNTKHISLRKDPFQVLNPRPLHSVCIYTHIVRVCILILYIHLYLSIYACKSTQSNAINNIALAGLL